MQEESICEGGSMKLRLILTGLAVVAATVLPTAASAGEDHGRGRWLSLPPDLTTGYLQGHYPHRDPVHPDAKYRHRKLSTADNRGVDGSTRGGEDPAGRLCDFASSSGTGRYAVLGVDHKQARSSTRGHPDVRSK